MNLLAIQVRHERRLRVFFSGAVLGGGNWNNIASYTVENLDGAGAYPGVAKVLPAPGNTAAADILLDADITPGGLYQLNALGIQGADFTSTPNPATQPFRWGDEPGTIDDEQPQEDVGAIVYGIDLVHNGDDFVEGPDGDLTTVSGLPNAQGAIERRLVDSDGLDWDPTYGARPDTFVGGPAPAASMLRGRLIRQALLDDRVRTAGASFQFTDASPEDAFFDVQLTLIGATEADKAAVAVPVGTKV